MDQQKVDKIIQCALAIASQAEDFRDRELGPIHLIKYVYLADLAYAQSHDGETYTGIPWQFYHFGPWDLGLFQHLDDATSLNHIQRREIQSEYDKDFTRWRYTNRHDASIDEEAFRSRLPVSIFSTLKNNIKRFGQDTYELLDFVYKTSPMLNAAPEEFLSFDFKKTTPLPSSQEEKLTAKQQKKRKATLKKIQEKLAEKRKKPRRKRLKKAAEPVYDEVFEKGVEWLDSLAGAPVEEHSGKVLFDENVWKSPSRRNTDDDC